jgi:hypothetical protein
MDSSKGNMRGVEGGGYKTLGLTRTVVTLAVRGLDASPIAYLLTIEVAGSVSIHAMNKFIVRIFFVV